MVEADKKMSADTSAMTFDSTGVEEDTSGGAPKRNKKKTKLDNKVIVRERDFKSTTTHKDIVSGIVRVNDNEFLTSSNDQSIKVWDKFNQGVSYTIETHEALTSMGITGEKDDILVCGLGDGHLILFGKDRNNQLAIVEWAHAMKITHIVSLNKMKGKYFATRCIDGHVNIYSSLQNPDRIARISNFDADEEALAHLQPKEEVVEEVKVEKKKKTRTNSDGEEEEYYDEEEDENDGGDAGAAEDIDDEEKKDEKPKILPPVDKIIIGRPEPSDRDTMIEITTKALIQTSSTMLAVSCFNEK